MSVDPEFQGHIIWTYDGLKLLRLNTGTSKYSTQYIARIYATDIQSTIMLPHNNSEFFITQLLRTTYEMGFLTIIYSRLPYD